MTAPGDHLEFLKAPAYQKRTEPAEEIDIEVQAHIKNHPSTGAEISPGTPGLKEIVIVILGMPYLVFVKRRGNRISLIDIFDVDDLDRIESKRQELIEMHIKR